jgi:hypothetical protein
MTTEEILARFPHASAAFIRANASDAVPIAPPIVARQTPMRKPRSDIGAKRPRQFQKCEACGKTFQAAKSQGRRFCSPACAYSDPARVAHIKPKERGTAKCAGCDNVFQLTRGNPNGKYCSQPCAASTIGAITIRANKGLVKEPHSRAKSGWLELGGKRLFARSSWEANYARYLQFQKVQGLIREWDHETETFWFEAIKRGTRSYLPDFKVTTNTGAEEFHEVKGWMDAPSKTKIRRMAKYHPTVKLVVVDSARYRVLAKQLASIVPGWDQPLLPRQEKVRSKGEERTEILIERLP